MFAARTGWNLARNAFSTALAKARESGRELIDLTLSNPTDAGLRYPRGLLKPLADPDALHYDPQPRGLESARAAVAAYYAQMAQPVELTIDQIFLTASTSEAYSFLFRLLCEPADEILIVQPGYPLFEFLAGIQDVRLRHVSLLYDHGWHLDMESVRRAAGDRVRAVILVSPNNPTGSYIKPQEQDELAAFCARRGLALIADEVFFDYKLQDSALPRSFAAVCECLTFTVSGISKICCLPQMKLGWVVVSGPDPLREQAAARLEVIADTYLSVGTPVQLALPRFLDARAPLQQQIVQRVKRNLKVLDALLRKNRMVSRLEVEAGWYAVLRVPAIESDEALTIALLEREGVVVHPGHFYEFPREGYLVVSLIPAPSVFREGISRLLRSLKH